MMSSKITGVVVLEEAGRPVNVNIRKLSHTALSVAQETRQTKMTKLASSLGPEMVRAFSETARAKDAAQIAADAASGAESKKETEKQREARYALYDRDIVLNNGVLSWDLKDESDRPVPKNEKTLADLDEKSADALHRAIVDLSVPAPEVLEAATSKD